MAERACAHELLEVVIWAVHSIASDMDRHLLGPMYQREMIYWLLQSEQGEQLRALASDDSASSRVSTVIEYARTHLAEPLSVGDMADLANLSTSAFARQFRDVTGRPPHQFLKEMRLSHARELVAEGDLTVTRISREVGYASVSQFISAFRSRFGMTPARVQQHSR
jgi:transcriptional regulator GlxA family with amidase domain